MFATLSDAMLMSCSNDGTVKMWDIVEEHDERIVAPTFTRAPSVVMHVMPLQTVAVGVSNLLG